jgi:flagellar biosynthesis protein FlhB
MEKSKVKKKVKKVMNEFSEGKLHSGSKKGPVVSNPKQAVAIGYSEARKKK